jgi:hypothetical protein
MSNKKINPALTALTLVLFLGAAACMPAPNPLLSSAWEYNQLRALDEPDASQSTLDLVAAYARNSGDEIQIRLDFLDQASLPDCDLYITLDAEEGGATSLPIEITSNLAWETLLIIPAEGPIQVLDSNLHPKKGNSLLVLRDPILDTMTISIQKESLKGGISQLPSNHGIHFQVFLVPSGGNHPADALGPVSINSASPAPAPVLFTFWDSYPAYTPLTALRRWAGAHTGPSGGSHGLLYLLQATRASQIPIVLLDLKNPAWLSALDYGDNLDIVEEMWKSGLLILPEYSLDDTYAPFPPDAQTLRTIQEDNLSITSRFGLSTSPFVYAPPGSQSAVEGNRFIFTQSYMTLEGAPVLKPTYIKRLRDQRILAVPNSGDQTYQATLEGPSLELKRSLVQTALLANNDPSSSSFALVLGGELPASSWGDPLPARRTLDYLARHPWVYPLTAHDLLTTRPAPDSSALSNGAPEPITQADRSLLAALQEAPSNSLSAAAWQAFSALSAPVFPSSKDLPVLRGNYAGDVWSILAAAQWAEAPSHISTCDRDPDHDGREECILTSERFYVQFEQQSGTLTHAFAILPGKDNGDYPHQWISPSSQFISGLSDPFYWNLDAGPVADPSVIRGAFYEPNLGYRVDTAGDCLIFTASQHGVRKTFCVDPGGLEVEYYFTKQPTFSMLQIPLALDPWRRFNSNWAEAYRAIHLPNGWSWGLDSGPKVQILSDSDLNLESFLDSRSFFNRPEDPNQDYPAGHMLPFPLALVNISVKGNLNLRLNIDQTFDGHLSIR